MNNQKVLKIYSHEKVSVIVPVYGTEKYINRCIDSIVYQTYSPLELVIVNDASVDNSEKIILSKILSRILSFFSDEFNKTINLIDIRFRISIKRNERCADCYLINCSDKTFSSFDCILNQLFDLEENGELIPGGNYEVSEEGKIVCVASKDSGYDYYQLITYDISANSKVDRYVLRFADINTVYVKHKVNMGLFQARLSGFDASTGEYISTVDSDDYIGVDYFRMLMKSAKSTNADVVVSEFVKEIEKTGYKGKRTQGIQAIRNLDLFDDDILQNFFDTEGELSTLWFVWGKLYKRQLWEKCYPEFLKVNKHQIMLEDMMYGAIFATEAHHYVSTEVDTYFYVANDSASTSKNGGYEKLYKNLDDIIYAFDYIERFLSKKGLLGKYIEKMSLIREKWGRTWYQIEQEYDLPENQRNLICEMIKDISKTDSLVTPTERDVFFYDINTPWDNREETLKRKIRSKKVIAFDIYDTLILRPFYKPSDLFMLMDEKYDKECGYNNRHSFSQLRINAEKIARERLDKEQFEEVTLDEIYRVIADDFVVPQSLAYMMMDLECELEIMYSYPRKKISEFFEYAKELGKTIVLISDMYLDKRIIERVLKKNNFSGYSALYLSSDKRLCKSSGKLFKYAIDEICSDLSEWIYFDDNWDRGCLPAKELGIEVWRTSSPIDLLFNRVADLNGKASRATFCSVLDRNVTGSYFKYDRAMGYFGIRCMLAVMANNIFDNPYVSYEPNTDFNRNPYNIGFMALGMHELGIALWIAQNTLQSDTVHFVARDGFLQKQIFDLLKEYIDNLPNTNYFYMSRKSFLPLTICEKNDWLGIENNINCMGKSPREILGYFSPIINPSLDLNKILLDNRLLFDSPLENRNQLYKLINVIQNYIHDNHLVNHYRMKMKLYFETIFKENDCIFDIGYSGRAEGIISELLGYGINAFFIHTLDDKSLTNSRKYGFKVNSFFDYVPSLTGKIRELIQSEPAPSCIGYAEDDNGIYPIFEDEAWHFHEKYVVNQIHKGAYDFVKAFLDIFSDKLHLMTFRNTDVSFIHECMIMNPRDNDMQIFKLFHFEDDLGFGKDYSKKKLIDIWNGDLEWQGLKSRKKVVKQIVNNKSGQKPIQNNVYVPYKEKLSVPKGLANKYKYFKQSDHILVKRYVFENKSRITYRIFSGVYCVLKTFKHYVNNTNNLGYPRGDYSLSLNGRVLYSATSAYAVLTCMLHKLIYHFNDDCDLLLSTWRSDKEEAVRNTGLFKNVIMWSDMSYRRIDTTMNELLKNGSEIDFEEQEYRFWNEYKKLLPICISDYKDIIIHGNSMPLGCFLEANDVRYSFIEDGAGLYTDYSLLWNSINNSYPELEKYMLKKYGIFQEGGHKVKAFINYRAQSRKFNKRLTCDFKPVELLDSISPEWRKKICDVFGVQEAQMINDTPTGLILTYPLAQREGLSKEEQKYIYLLLSDIYFNDCKSVHIKPHPDDRVDYSDFSGFKVINRNVLSELLWYETKTQYRMAVATVSSSMNNLLCIDRGIAISAEFKRSYTYLLLYYSAFRFIKCNFKDGCTITGFNVYGELFNSFLAVDDKKYQYQDEKNESISMMLKCQSKGKSDKSGDDTIIISFTKEQGDWKKVVLKKKFSGNYPFVPVLDEYFYVKSAQPLTECEIYLLRTGLKITTVMEDGYED